LRLRSAAGFKASSEAACYILSLFCFLIVFPQIG
jgi:hypothetical protein